MNIKKINSIDNFGSFHGFKWKASIPEFNRYNIIYGWNGSGKTTLSRLFRYISEQDFRTRHDANGETKAVLEVELKNGTKINAKDGNLDGKVKVFNAEYISENLKWDDCSTKGIILFVGKIAAEKKDELEKLEKELQLLRNKRDGLKTAHDGKEQVFEKWLNETVAPIRKDANLIGNAYNINKFKEGFTKALSNESAFVVLTDDELTKFKNAVKEVNDRGELNESTPDLKGINPEAITTSVNEILSCDLIPNEDDELQLIENDKEIFTWVETGVKIHQHRDKCLFCGEDYKTTRREKLISFFQTKQAELIDKIDQLIRDIQNYTKKVELSRHPDNSLFQEFRTDYQQKYELQLAAWESLLNGLKIMVEAAEWKKSHLFDPYETKAAEVQGANINLLIQDFVDKSKTKEDVIKRHNARVVNFDKAQKEAKEKILQHHIKSLLPKYKEHNEAVNAASAKFIVAKTEFDTLSQRIGTIKSELSNAKKGADAINTHLESMGHGHIRLEEAEGEIGYALTRMKKRAKNLSEGEKTAVAVAFFINSLKDSNFKLKDSILVIDDPVSSLDANVLFFVFSMIKEYTSDAAQLFLLTHNHQFFVRLIRWKAKEKVCNCYEIKREINHSEERLNSVLSPLDGYLIKWYNEYHHLFFLLYSCCKSANNNVVSEDSRFTHLNVARRVLECFFGFWYPGSSSLEKAIENVKNDLEEKDSENFEALCQSAYIVTNIMSHGNIDAVMGMGEAANSETPDTTIRNCLKIIETLVPKHYNQMSAMCDNGGDFVREAIPIEATGTV